MFRRSDTDAEPTPVREIRLVPARILTEGGWLVGKMHVAAEWRLINFINNAPEFFSIADTVIEGRPRVFPLFTLQRAAIQFIVVESDPDKEIDHNARNQIEHPIACLLRNGVLLGRLNVPRGVRLSDFLSRQKGFLLLKEVHFHLQNPWEKRVIDHREPFVLLNSDAVVGISEWTEDPTK
jgi:hypothetical protein